MHRTSTDGACSEKDLIPKEEPYTAFAYYMYVVSRSWLLRIMSFI